MILGAWNINVCVHTLGMILIPGRRKLIIQGGALIRFMPAFKKKIGDGKTILNNMRSSNISLLTERRQNDKCRILFVYKVRLHEIVDSRRL